MKNKILSVFCVFILLSIILINNVFAFSNTFEYNKTKHNIVLPDTLYNTFLTLDEYKSSEYNFMISEAFGVGHIHFIPKNLNLKVWVYDFHLIDTNILEISNYSAIYYKIDLSNGAILEKNDSTTDFCSRYYITNDNTEHHFYTDMIIYTDSSCTEIFYKSSIFNFANVFDNTQPYEVFKNLMSNVIVILITVIAGILAFRKAWSFLKGESRRA